MLLLPKIINTRAIHFLWSSKKAWGKESQSSFLVRVQHFVLASPSSWTGNCIPLKESQTTKVENNLSQLSRDVLPLVSLSGEMKYTSQAGETNFGVLM